MFFTKKGWTNKYLKENAAFSFVLVTSSIMLPLRKKNSVIWAEILTELEKRMHSSRMRTDRCSGRHQMSVAGGGCLHSGGFHPVGGIHLEGVCLPTFPVNGQRPLKTLPSPEVGKTIIMGNQCTFC